MTYREQYQSFLRDAESFWAEQARRIEWYRQPGTILASDSNDYPRWFPDGELNTSFLCLDYHVAQGRGEQPALIYDSPVTGTKSRLTYRELTGRVAKFAGALRALGVEYGDRVVIYMPMVPEAAIAMLACARLGAVHSVVFGGFAPAELAARIDDATPRIVIAATCGIEFNRVLPYQPLVEEAVGLARHKPESVVLLQRPQCVAGVGTLPYYDWSELEAAASPVAPVTVKATDPLYILYTSGTTGKPKGVVRDHGGHAVALHYSMDAVYGVDAGDVFWAASDVGWVVGHSYIVYGPLLRGCTSILYEGKPVRTPDAGSIWRICAEYGVKVFFTAPTAFRAVRKEDPEGLLLRNYDLSRLQRIYQAGERLDPATCDWLQNHSGVPVLDHWWQTETAWAVSANPAGIELLPAKAGSAGVPMPGYQIKILDSHGEQEPAGSLGNIVIRLPLPPGCLSTVWNDHPRLVNGYLADYPGYYLTGDEGYFDDDGYLYVMGRVDDVINVAGHRLSTGQMEGIVSAHPAVAECAVFGVADEVKGQVPMGLVVLKDGVVIEPAALAAELREMVRHRIGAIACYDRTVTVQRLPKTRSGKILRRVLRQIADGQPYAVPATIDDPAILGEIADALALRGP